MEGEREQIGRGGRGERDGRGREGERGREEEREIKIRGEIWTGMRDIRRRKRGRDTNKEI